MNASVIDIVFFIFKLLFAIGIVFFIFSSLKVIGEVISIFIGGIFSLIWSGFTAIGFQSSLWNVIPFMVIFVCGFSSIASYLWPSPNDPNWIWLLMAVLCILFFTITLALNIYLKPKSASQEWNVTPTPKEWPPTITEWHVTPNPTFQVDPDKLKKWREHR